MTWRKSGTVHVHESSLELQRLPRAHNADHVQVVQCASHVRGDPDCTRRDIRVRRNTFGYVGALDDAGCGDSSEEPAEARLLFGILNRGHSGGCLDPE